ncbi:MAG: hypothetical protein ACI9XR_000436 [Flavobacterium sp.]|jgi:hypothetical protein
MHYTSKIILSTISFTLLFYFLNLVTLHSLEYSQALFLYLFPLEQIFITFSILAIIVLFVLHIVEKKNKDIVGMVFLIASSIQIGVLYFIFRKVISSSNLNTIERINFFVLFFLFLTFETLIIIQLLNKKQ